MPGNTPRRTARAAGLLLGAVGSLLVTACEQPQDRAFCHVLLVTLDTFRADRLGCYGNGTTLTSHFDALAADGIRFDTAISVAAVTPVSHASILTGLYPYQHGVRVMHAATGYALDPAIPTIATTLRGAGWRTGAFLSAFPVSEYFGFEAGFDRFDNGISDDYDSVMEEKGGVDKWSVADNQRRSDVTIDGALAWLDEVAGSGEPFFLWTHLWDPHDAAILPPPEFGRLPANWKFSPGGKRRLYDLEAGWVDRQFGRLVAELKERGLYDDTLILVVADHGQGLGDHGWWDHRILYQEQIRVPLIVRPPGGAAGKSSRRTDGRAAATGVRELVRSIDIFPTVLDWTGTDVAGHVEGRSLRPLIEGAPDDPRLAYADQLNLFDTNASTAKRRPKDDLVYCVMDAQWKLLWRPRHPDESELFRIADDPGERRDLSEAEPEQFDRLHAVLEESGGIRDEPFGESADDEARERLKSLGYFGN